LREIDDCLIRLLRVDILTLSFYVGKRSFQLNSQAIVNLYHLARLPIGYWFTSEMRDPLPSRSHLYQFDPITIAVAQTPRCRRSQAGAHPYDNTTSQP
jgi:hypothetical protein